MISVLHTGDCGDPEAGALAWWRRSGEPSCVVVTDPPYWGVGSTRSSAAPDGEALSYGALTEILRRDIADICAVAHRSAVFCVTEDLGRWREALESAGLGWSGAGVVCQRRGAPRLDGLAPGVRMLGVALARQRRRLAWRGRAWAEWHEYRDSGAVQRPIRGTRSVRVMAEIIHDLTAGIPGTPIVVDPCAGTGTTLVAARLQGLRAVGWEIDEDTASYARGALAAEGPPSIGQEQLFAR